MIIVPLCPQSHLSSKATTLNNNTTFLSISMHNVNWSIILNCLGGLPNYMALILEICEITYVPEDSKSPKKKKLRKKLWSIIKMSKIYMGALPFFRLKLNEVLMGRFIASSALYAIFYEVGIPSCVQSLMH